MPKQPKAIPTESSDAVALATVVQELTHQVRELALILDEIREDIAGMVRNGLGDPGMSRRSVEELLPEEEEDEGCSGDDEMLIPPPPVSPPPVRHSGRPPQQRQQTLFS